MVGEVFAGIGAFKTMFDMAKALKDINDATIRNTAVIELQEQILTAQATQTQLLDEIRSLKEKMAGFEEWNAEKQRYELKALGWGALAFMLKPDARGSEPPHWVCPNCFKDRLIAIIQRTLVKGQGYQYACPECKNTIHPSGDAMTGDDAKWLD